MSLPNIPDIDPLISLNRCDAINLLLSSIALEEISLSHILNAEGEKLQKFLRQKAVCTNDLLRMNESVQKSLQTVVKSQLLLVMKLEEVVELAEHTPCFPKHCTCKKDGKQCKSCRHHACPHDSKKGDRC